MSYNKHVFNPGDELFASDLNYMNDQVEANANDCEQIKGDLQNVIAFNLIQKNMVVPRHISANGLMFDIDSDGYITINGTATTSTSQSIIASSAAIPIYIEEGYYTLSGCINQGKDYNTYVGIRQGSTVTTLRSSNGPGTYYLSGGSSELYMGIRFTKDLVFDNEKVYFMLEKGKTAHDYTDPAIQKESLSKALSAIQAIDPENMLPPMSTKSINGLTLKVNSDGSLVINGTAEKNTSIPIVAQSLQSEINLGRYYTISGSSNGSESSYWLYAIIDIGGSTTTYRQYDKPYTFFLRGNNNEYGHYWFGIHVNQGVTLNSVIFKPMLERGLYHETFVSPYTRSDNFDTIPVMTPESITMSEAARLVKTEWSPITDIPNFDAGDKYYGLPYHANLHLVGRDILINRTLETFFSVVKNPASILYSGKYDDESGDPAYGAMCSSFTSWFFGQKIMRWTSELYAGYIETYEYTGIESVAVGDVLVSYQGGEGHVMIVSGIDIDADTGRTAYIRILDETHPTIRERRFDIGAFETLLNTYKIGKYPDAELVNISPLRYSTDIITEYGNNTYFATGDDIWCYISTDNKVITIKNLSTATEKTVVPSATKIVNGVMVYNISEFLIDNAEYEVTTNPEIKNRCKILRIKTGNASRNGNTVTISGYSENAKPEWAYLYATDTTLRRIDSLLINGDNFDISKATTGSYSSFYLKVYYKTKYGYAVKDTQTFSV